MRIVEESQATILGVSSTMLFNLPKVRRLIADALVHFPSRRLRVLVGGGAFHAAPNLPAEIGADGYAADLRSVVVPISV